VWLFDSDNELFRAVEDNNVEGILKGTWTTMQLGKKFGDDRASSLMQAVYTNKMDVVKALVQIGADVDTTAGRSGAGVLTVAGLTHNLDVAKFLLENGADPNIQSKWGMTALMYAARERWLGGVALLLKHGARLELKGTRQHARTPQTVWEHAQEAEGDNSAVIELLNIYRE
jgi:ankyrin repeat protein